MRKDSSVKAGYKKLERVNGRLEVVELSSSQMFDLVTVTPKKKKPSRLFGLGRIFKSLAA